MTIFFTSMSRLFATHPVKDTDAERQGLWGELFLMNQINGFRFFASFWHPEVRRIFDFSFLNKHIEVKTTLNTERVHHFSHRQLYGQKDEEIVILSIMLISSEYGLSLKELIDKGRIALSGSPNYLKLEQAIIHADMVDTSIEGPKYNSDQALRNMKWYRSIDVPRFNEPEPIGVSETRYKVTLENAKNLDPKELENWLAKWQETNN